MKYYLTKNGEGEYGVQDGWIYTRTANDHIYRIHALMMSDLCPSFSDRKKLIKDVGIELVKEDYDMDFINRDEPCSPPVYISESRAKEMIAKWKKQDKELWPNERKK